MVCGLKYRQVKVRAFVRACGDQVGSETRLSTTLLPRAWVWVWVWVLAWIWTDGICICKWAGLNPIQAVSVDNTEQGP